MQGSCPVRGPFVVGDPRLSITQNWAERAGRVRRFVFNNCTPKLILAAGRSWGLHELHANLDKQRGNRDRRAISNHRDSLTLGFVDREAELEYSMKYTSSQNSF